MGNGITKNPCFSGDPYAAAVATDPPPDNSLGHSFTYVRSSSSLADPHQAMIATAAAAMMAPSPSFSLSGAAISANLAASASMPSLQLFNEMTWPPSCACTFESSRSFAAAPLQAAPRLSMSGPLHAAAASGRFSDTSASTVSGALSDAGGPFLSGALDRSLSGGRGGILLNPPRSSVADRRRRRREEQASSILGFFARTASRLRFRRAPGSYVRRTDDDDDDANKTVKVSVSDGDYRSPPRNGNVEWAQGAAGEDRFHVAVSEERGWIFVGIYDGFNGPDATDYLFANLYVAVREQLRGLLWDECDDDDAAHHHHNHHHHLQAEEEEEDDNADDDDLCLAPPGSLSDSNKRRRMERPVALQRDAHRDVLKALARALRKTEEAFFEAAEQRAEESPDLGMVGSCVLVMLMKGPDVYVMNVGDSRAVLARRPEPDLDILGSAARDLAQFKSQVMRELHGRDAGGLQAVQLTPEHSTAVEEEVRRIKSQHLNDRNAITNHRVKGKINVTRAFGAGYLKEPKWNNRLLRMFKINYVGTEPYITCAPSLCHHRIGSHDKFLVLSSDGLYQYFTNKEVVDLVDSFTAQYPDGDPSMHLLSELVLRAARKAGMESHQLLDIPRGDRRLYHDDVSIIVISFEGRIWRSSF
ncbi:hypothetical protein PR202_gb19395 [Eleusine coracana subsp. coracana]|uniref:protein-serine/threonine phosphatase n=1 Tax=Eleusine coracana subsp. coracana TaxID=191504 RepID=A0AAV5F7T3_ELECO|nr:hypothetical protein PR202_gb19395 [Eleusine coracana subsp. coracana]